MGSQRERVSFRLGIDRVEHEVRQRIPNLTVRAHDVHEVDGENLLHDRRPEYGKPSPMRVEIERGVYAKIVWQF